MKFKKCIFQLFKRDFRCQKVSQTRDWTLTFVTSSKFKYNFDYLQFLLFFFPIKWFSIAFRIHVLQDTALLAPEPTTTAPTIQTEICFKQCKIRSIITGVYISGHLLKRWLTFQVITKQSDRFWLFLVGFYFCFGTYLLAFYFDIYLLAIPLHELLHVKIQIYTQRNKWLILWATCTCIISKIFFI